MYQAVLNTVAGHSHKARAFVGHLFAENECVSQVPSLPAHHYIGVASSKLVCISALISQVQHLNIMTGSALAVEVEGLSFNYYGGATVLSNVNFVLEKGRRCLLVGGESVLCHRRLCRCVYLIYFNSSSLSKWDGEEHSFANHGGKALSTCDEDARTRS